MVILRDTGEQAQRLIFKRGVLFPHAQGTALALEHLKLRHCLDGDKEGRFDLEGGVRTQSKPVPIQSDDPLIYELHATAGRPIGVHGNGIPDPLKPLQQFFRVNGVSLSEVGLRKHGKIRRAPSALRKAARTVADGDLAVRVGFLIRGFAGKLKFQLAGEVAAGGQKAFRLRKNEGETVSAGGERGQTPLVQIGADDRTAGTVKAHQSFAQDRQGRLPCGDLVDTAQGFAEHLRINTGKYSVHAAFLLGCFCIDRILTDLVEKVVC